MRFFPSSSLIFAALDVDGPPCLLVLSLFCGKIQIQCRHEQDIAFFFSHRLRPYFVSFLSCPLITESSLSSLSLFSTFPTRGCNSSLQLVELFLHLSPVSLIPGPILCVYLGASDFLLGTYAPFPRNLPELGAGRGAVKTDLLQPTAHLTREDTCLCPPR